MTGGWRWMLGGLIVWTAHFMGVYAIGEFWGEGTGPRIAVGVLTAVGLAVVASIGWQARRLPLDGDFAAWRRSVAGVGALVASVAILWQGLPALF